MTTKTAECSCSVCTYAPSAPHHCLNPDCPGDVNRRRLEAYDGLLAVAKQARSFPCACHETAQEDRLCISCQARVAIACQAPGGDIEAKPRQCDFPSCRTLQTYDDLLASHDRLLKACKDFCHAMSQPCPDYYGMSKTAVEVRPAIAKAEEVTG